MFQISSKIFFLTYIQNYLSYLPDSLRSIFFILLFILSSSKRNFLISAKLLTSQQLTETNPQYRPFSGGRDIDGEQLYVCRVFRFGQILPGKFSNSLQKCSISFNDRESQFHRFELLVRNRKTKYDWIPVKAPVRKLPDNVLFGGNRFATQLMMYHSTRSLNNIPHNGTGMLLFGGDESNPDFWNHFLTHNIDWSLRKRRLKTETLVNQNRKVQSKIPEFTIPILSQLNHNPVNCSQQAKHHTLIKPQTIECMQKPDSQKLNYYIAKCTLRTGNVTSEQIGKVRWMEPANQWLASFAFGGNEIYCLDFSVLTLKDS